MVEAVLDLTGAGVRGVDRVPHRIDRAGDGPGQPEEPQQRAIGLGVRRAGVAHDGQVALDTADGGGVRPDLLRVDVECHPRSLSAGAGPPPVECVASPTRRY
ncbi:hypothetical protein GCM10011314_26340 [Knoellia flava]|uniref:Uncharacterized protein n=1 Tax=Knoellia flava TaxID=913969 RepID=A0A8H9FTZ3_9MICO|nr:hypothetical protein GCM10011314_26340 [Knoellia flava]